MDPFLPDAEKVAAVRELLPATGAGIYLDTASAGPLPAETARALAEADDWELRVGRVGPGRADDVAARADEARAVVAALLGTDPDGIVLVHGVADAVTRLRLALDGRRALVVQAHVDERTGAMLPPARDVGDGAAPSLIVLDASCSAGAIPLAPAIPEVDAVALAGDRWLLGPEGIGALWLSPGMRALVDASALQDLGGTPPRRALLGLARSLGWLHMYVGLPWAIDRTAALVGRLVEALATIPGVELLASRERTGAIVSFRISGWRSDEVADELGRRVFSMLAVVDAPDGACLRTSVGAWNTAEELDRFADAVAEIARHTPASLPRRPTLVILPGSGSEA